jgi:TonB family protein
MALVCAWASPVVGAPAEGTASPPAAEPPAREVIEPPVARDTPVEYPETETTSAVVVLELELDATGAVLRATIAQGEPPFSDVALAAARDWSFTPARRGGRAVGARLRYSVRFDPPPVEKVAEAAPAAPSVTPTPVGPLEVVVTGERKPKPPPGTVIITREEARALPGTFGDPLRALEAQPGVVPILSGLPSFFVRGAPPGNVGYFIDGVDVPLLYHAFFGPSVIHPGLIESVELFKGAAPVEYGRFAGPILAAKVSPLQHRFNGEASIRAIDAGALIEVPFGECPTPGKPDCSLGSARVGGRYAYTGFILSQITDAKLDYWDYQGHASVDVGPSDSVGVLAFGAYDYFNAGATSDQGGGRVTFHRLDLRWDHHSGATRTRVGVTGGFDSTGGVEETTSVVRDRSLRVRGQLEADLGEAATLRAGADGRVDDFDLRTDPLLLNFADYSRLFPTRTEYAVGAYVAIELRPTRRITVIPGVRGDFYYDRGTTAVGVDPRISAEFQVSENVTLHDSLGMAHQRPNFVPNVPGAQVADLEHGLQEALVWSSGVRWKLPLDFSVTAEVFRSAYFNALDPLGGKRDFSIDRTVVDRRTTIASAGFELLISRSLTRRLGGFLAYTLSHTEQSFQNEESVSGFDRPHVLQVALGYDFGHGYSAGVRGVAYSGVPENNLQGTPHFTTNRRGRPYFRLDVRAEKRWKLGQTAWWAVTAEALNATATTEVERLDCGERCAERVAGPVFLPSIGVAAGF